jgi:hypothetical protein
MDSPPYTIKADNQIYTVQKSISQYPGQPTYEYLKIADGHRCLQYSYATDNSDEIELYWLHLAGAGGEINIQDEAAVLLFRVSVQVLQCYTSVSHIKFLENKHFWCVLPDKTTVTISYRHYYYFFHQRSWFHDKLGAYPYCQEDVALYESYAKNFDDPDMKPKYFDFRNEDLNQIFRPIWDTSKTWKEFIRKIEKLPNICQKVYPWYRNAMSILMGRRTMPDSWLVDVSKLKNEKLIIERMGNDISGFPKMEEYEYDLPIFIDYPSPDEARSLKYL